MKAIGKIFLIALFSFIISVFVDNSSLNYLVEKFIFSATSIMVGLTIAVVGIFMGNINSLYLSMIDLFNRINTISDEEKAKIIDQLNSIKNELKDNIKFTIYAFVGILCLFFLKEMDIPFINWPFTIDKISKDFVINVAIITLNFSIILAVYDSVSGAFKLSNALEITKKNSGNS